MADTSLYLGVFTSGSIVWTLCSQFSSFIGLVVTDGLMSEADTMTLSMVFLYDDSSGDDMPLEGQMIRLVVGDKKVFEGIITGVANAWHTASSTGIALNCSSNLVLLNCRYAVMQDLPDEPAGERIKRILDEFGDTFNNDYSYIEGGPVIPGESYDYQNIPSLISKIAGQVGYLWYVDFDRAVHFYANLSDPAPITSVTDDTTSVGDLTVGSDSSGIANIIILKDYSSKAQNRTDHTTSADGNTSFFSLPMPPFSIEDTDVQVSTDGGDSWTQYQLMEDPLDGAEGNIRGYENTAFLCTFNWGVRFGTDFIPPNDALINANYNAEDSERVTVVFDEDSIAEFARRENSDGHHELVVSVSDFRVSNEDPIMALGQMMLNRRAWPVVSGDIRLLTTNYCEWKPGQTFTIYSAKRNIYDLRAWVQSGYVTKSAIQVWVERVKREFIVTDDGIIESDTISFTSQPWE